MLQENKELDYDNINGIISKSKIQDGVEFVFGTPESEEDEGLVFETAVPEKEPEPNVSRLSFEHIEEEEKRIEFSVPDKFRAKTDLKKSSASEEAPRIRTTYVPNFTGAADNIKMKGDTRLTQNDINEKEENKPEPKKSVTTEPRTREPEVDPTAEIDENFAIPKIPVAQNSSKAEEEATDSSSRVFRFFNEEELEKREEPVTELSEVEDDEEQGELSEEVSEEREYVIPDPYEDVPEAITYTPIKNIRTHSELEAPAGIGDKYPKVENKSAEYLAPVQRDSFKDRFLDSIMSVKVRFFAAAIIALVLLVFENLFVLGVDIPEMLGLATLPGAMAFLDMQFVICLYLLAIPETVYALKNIVRGKVVPEITLTLSFAVTILYSALIGFVYSPSEYYLFGFIFSISVISSMGSSYFRRTADFTAFKLISLGGEKIVVDRKYTRTLENENSALDGIIEEHKSKCARMFKTTFVNDFFVRSKETAESTNTILITLSSAFGISLVTALVAYFIPGGNVSAISAFTLVFLMSIPAFAMMSRKLPYYYASEEAESEMCAVIGESTLCDYAGIDVITFEDTEVFGVEDVKLQRILLYGQNDNLSKALSQMSALFMNVGGPLDYLFSNSLDRKCHPADSTTVFEGGVSGVIGEHTVLAGTMDFMLSCGVKIPEEKSASSKVGESTRIIYAAEDGEVYAKFYISYSFSEEFSMLLPVLYDEGIVPLVYTRDPNITEGFIKMLTAGSDKIRILRKYDSPEYDYATYRSISAGVVSLGDKISAINTILIAKKYGRFQEKLRFFELGAMASGALLSVIISIIGAWMAPPVIFGALQAALALALHIISKRRFSFIRSPDEEEASED